MTAEELRKHFPNAPESFIQANASGLPAGDAKPVEGRTLVSPQKGDASRRNCPTQRALLRLRIFAVRPADADGWDCKQAIDLLVHAGILAGDAWHQLEIAVRSEKVHTAAEERTEILIEWPS